jgi:hypothetical protein
LFGHREVQGMAEAKDCPKCRLVNPPSAQRCDCGYDFVTKTTKQSYLSPGSRTQSGGSPVVGYGCLLLGLGLSLWGIVTAMMMRGAGDGGAFAMGQICGGFLPGLAAFGFGAYLLRRSR